MAKYKCSNVEQQIYLHDCIVTEAYIDENNLILGFHNGIWLTKTNEFNPTDVMVRTDKAFFKIEDMTPINMWLCKRKNRLFPQIYKKIDFDINELADNINNGKWTLELIESFYYERRVLFTGYINEKKHSDYSQIVMDYSNITCTWDKIQTDVCW